MKERETVKSLFSREQMKIIAGACLLAMGQSLHRRRDSYTGFYLEHGKSSLNAKGKAQVGNTYKAKY
jgi:hypothetical protein